MNTRKGLAYLLIGLLSLTTSCSDDDDSIGDVVDGLVEDGEEIVDGVVDEGEGVIEDGGDVVDEAIDGGEDEAEEPDVRATVVLNEINYLGDNDWIEIFNPTSGAIDLSEYWLCMGRDTYRQFSNAELNIVGNTVLESGEFLVITGYNLPDTNGGLGLYSTNAGGFVDPNVLVDFVQYGMEGSPRENVADEAELWEVDTFVPLITSESGSIGYSGSGVGVDSWSQTTQETAGQVNAF